MPRLSVLLPVRNGGAFLERAVASTLRALPPDSELVAFDDRSTDRTQEVLERLGRDQRLRTLTSSSGSGLTHGLNQLLDRTDSAFVARMDADDVTLPWRFQVQDRAARRHDVVFSNIIFINASGRPVRPDVPGPLTSRSLGPLLTLGNFLVHPTMYARRSAIELAGGYRDVPCEDYDLWMRLLSGGAAIKRVSTPTILYRRHASQTSGSDTWLAWMHKAGPSADALAGAYGELVRVFLGVDNVPEGWFEFAMQGVPRTASGAQGLHDAVGRAIHGAELPPIERLVAQMRSWVVRTGTG